MPRKQNKRRADGRIAVQVYLGKVDGKRRYKTVYGNTQKEADEAALQVKLALRKGIDVTAERDTFGDWAQRWLGLKKGNVSAKHYASLESEINHLQPIAHLPISKIRTSDIQDILQNLSIENPSTGRPMSKKTLNDIKNAASGAFRLAIMNRVTDFNPAEYAEVPQGAPRSGRRALTDEEQGWIIDTPHRAQTAAMIMLFAGLRRGEVIPLTWSDVDLKARTIMVNKAVEFVGSRAELKAHTKTDAGMRVIDLPQILVDFLAGKKRDNFLVCPAASGGMMSDTAWRRMWESYLFDLNLKYGNAVVKRNKFDPRGNLMVIDRFTAHNLRHTYATMLYKAGVDVLTAKEQLGHADIKTTLNIYTHLDREYKRRTMDKLDQYLDASQMQVSTFDK
ncbi:MAG: tyrosine-type recombinase/integrase [Acutalibacteraceae bacterium]|jgi:integrase